MKESNSVSDIDEFVMMTGTTHVERLPVMYHRPDGSTTGGFFAADDRFPGAWGEGTTEDAALDVLCDVIRDWWQIKSERRDSDLPPCAVSFSGRSDSDG